jgi:four helix bundle protein
MEYNLEERTTKFAISVVKTLKKVTITSLNKRIIGQLVGSSGSVGANYHEANGAESKNDFIHKLNISLKEIKETQHWLRIMAEANPEIKDDLKSIFDESQELLLIFSKVISSTKKPKIRLNL